MVCGSIVFLYLCSSRVHQSLSTGRLHSQQGRIEIRISATVLIVLSVVTMVVGFTLVSGIVVSTLTLRSSGVVASASLGVYSDSACTQGLSAISWGTIDLGTSIMRTFYVKNTGNIGLRLSLAAANWSPPSANGPVVITWNQEGKLLSPNQVVSATVTLSVSTSTGSITDFGVDILISGEA
jgi:hypothetical protein